MGLAGLVKGDVVSELALAVGKGPPCISLLMHRGAASYTSCVLARLQGAWLLGH